jgi:hypothetical protein
LGCLGHLVEFAAGYAGERWMLYLLSLSMLILFVVVYSRYSKPINRLQTEAAKTGGKLDSARELQASWDRSLMVRVPVLVICMLAQFVALLATSA